ncbi:MAG: aspartate aminotransferase family protein [Acetobacteraceae bacterium]|nr:aspartate aminotransferase family protein [Acetobacteraceae bacterium]
MATSPDLARPGTSGRPNRPDQPLAVFDQSRKRIERASRFMPAGVSSNFRAGMLPHPLVFERASGPYLFDVDGNRLIDYYLGMGPMILGHDYAPVRRAVEAQLARGFLYGGQSGLEEEAAELFCAMVPCAEKLRFCGSGSEAVQAALRIARAATGRRIVLKFEGHYHGWFDSILVSVAPRADQAGERLHPASIPGSIGQDASAWGSVEVLAWNDLALLEARLAAGDVAAVIMEPAMCNAGAIFPKPGYLEGVRAACTKAGTVLIFDEVITGFRVAPGGAQQLFGVTPDLATFAKAVASGFPVAAVAGRAELLDVFTKGAVHGGTYNAQPVTMAATLASLRALHDGSAIAGIAQHGTRLMEGIAAELKAAGIVATVVGFPQIFHVAFGLDRPAQEWRDLLRMDRARYVRFCAELLKRRVRALERGAWFLSTTHDSLVIDETLAAVADAAREVA